MSMKLRPHQEKVVSQAREILKARGVVLLALAPRTGKTFCALTLASEVKGRCLFVTKKAAIGSILADSEAMGGWGDRLVVTNYESLHKPEYCHGGFAVVVIDEVHRISAPRKPCKAARLIRGICAGASQVVMLSGTPAIESSAQWFNIFWATALGPWKRYGGGIMAFYSWFKDYGIPEPIRISGGQEVESYKRVKACVADEVAPYSICMTQAEVGFKQSAQLVKHYIDDDEAMEISHRLKRDGVVELVEHTVVAENPAAVLQKQAMVCGGTLIDDEGESFVVGSKKVDYLASKLCKKKQYAIFTQYVAERDHVIDKLIGAGFNADGCMDAFKSGEIRIFVGSIKRYSEGVDLSFIDGSMVLYSLTFSGATFVQILDRMNNLNRSEPIRVNVLLTRGSVEESILEAVSNKRNFNEAFLNA